jgi:DNA-binding MarR family transcriptional regulator
MSKEELEYYQFINDRQKVLANIYFTNNWLNNKYQGLLKSNNLTLHQFNLLKILKKTHPKSTTVSLIKTKMLDKNSDVTRMIERLLEKKLLVRQHDTENRRKINVKLTVNGNNLISKMDKEIRNFEDFVEHLSDKEIKQLNILLNKIRKP